MKPPQNQCKFLTQWAGDLNNFAVLLNIYSKWQARIGNFDITETTDENATRISGSEGKVLTYKQAISFAPLRDQLKKFRVTEKDYLPPLQGDLLFPNGVKE